MLKTPVPSSLGEPPGDMPQHLLTTKLVPPRVSGRVVARDKLIAQLLEARRQRCIVLQGPAGYGKTTTLVTLRQALLPLGFDVAWLTLTPGDDEPTRFLDYLVASLHQLDPAITREAAELAGHGVDREAIERTVIALIRGIGRHPRELVLVLDDLQVLQDARIHEALQWLLDYSPPRLHLVLATRGTVPMSLARLRAQHLVLELDLRELRFTPEESERFLAAQLGPISPRDAMRLHELTDGWVAGLQLLALDWKKRRQEAGAKAPTGSEFVQAHVQDPRAFAEYFEREVLSRLAPAELELLILASACNRFCAALCAALLSRPEAVADSAALLARLEAANLFIVPVEGSGPQTWYRLHPLLRETLRERLGRRSEARRRAVHTAAWRWFQEHGLLDEAVRHAVEAGESHAASRLLEQSTLELALRGELRKLIGLVHLLPAQQVQASLTLRMWMARLALFARDFSACATAIRELKADLPSENTHARFGLLILEVTFAVQRDDVAAATALLPQLLEPPPPGADPLLVGGRDNLLSWIYMHRGDYERARQVQADNPKRLVRGVPVLGTSGGVLQGRCLVGLSYALQGDLARAERIYRDVLHEAGKGGRSCAEPGYMATALLGEVLYEHDDAKGVLELLEERVDVLERVSIPDSVLRLLYMLSAAHWRLGNRLESLAYLDRLEDYATHLQLDRLLAFSLAAQAQRQMQMGSMEEANELIRRLDEIDRRRSPGSTAGYGEIGVMTERTHVRWLVARGDLDAAARRLAHLLQSIEARGQHRLLAQLLIIRALIERRLGHEEQTRASVMAALASGHRLGLVRTLLDADPDAAKLIRMVGAEPAMDPVLAFYVERLCPPETAADPLQPSAPYSLAAAPSAPLEALSDRELDVVHLLAQTLPNKKIARALGVSPETVKWHLKNIYGKLGVSGRDEAVARVKDLSLGDRRH